MREDEEISVDDPANCFNCGGFNPDTCVICKGRW